MSLSGETTINPYLAGIVVFVTTLFQTQFLPAFWPGVNQFVPDLLLLLIIAWALLLEWRWVLPVAFGAGLLLDLIDPTLHPLGLNALLFTLIAMSVSLLAQNPLRATVIRAVPITLGAALLFRLSRLLAERVLGYNNVQYTVILQVVIPVVIIDAALMILIFVMVRALSRVQSPRE